MEEMRQLGFGLYQGDISDLNSFKEESVREHYQITMFINVGSTPFVPRGIPSIYAPMFDVSREDDVERAKNDWHLVIEILGVALDEIDRGGRVLVTCDAGFSRSVVFSAMVLSIFEGIEMDDALMQRVRTPVEDPSPELWADAKLAVTEFWEEAIMRALNYTEGGNT